MYITSSPPRPFSSRRFGLGQASLAATGITGGITAGLDVASAIAQYALQSATQRDDTTNIANYAEMLMNENSQSYNSCQESQATAISNFNQIWAWLVQECSNPSFGTAGGACVQDRQAGGKLDWFKIYLDTYSNPPSPNNYVGNAQYGSAPAACTFSGSSAAATSGTGCLALFSLLGIQEPCIGPVGAYTALAGLALAAFLLKG